MPRIVFSHARDAQAAADWLTARLASADHGPFERPVILAPHPALQRFLTLEVARRTGIAASLRSLTPTAWVDEVTGLEGVAREWRPAAMAWALVDVLRDPDGLLPDFLRRLADSGDELALLDVARAIAHRFRTYLLHEPAILERAESGEAPLSRREEHERWQRDVWTRLIARIGTPSPTRVLQAARGGTLQPTTALPRIVYVVSEPGIPPTTRALLESLSAHCAIEWCVLDHGPNAPEQHSSTRRRAASAALATLGFVPAPVAPVGRTLLARTQAQFCAGDAAIESGTLDDTLSVHRCHSPLREIETLRELALDALAADPTLRPHDITLYVTSLEEYLPAVDIAFGSGVDGNPWIPFTVAGRPLREQSPVTGAVLDLLALVDGRLSLRELGAFLALPPVAAAAGLSEDEVPEALALLERARVVWGRDAADRSSRFGLPALEEGTWREGLDRLALGIATGPSDAVVDGLLPVAGETLGAGGLLARVIAWSDTVFEVCDELRVARPAREWAPAVEGATRRLVHVDDAAAASALRVVRDAVEAPLATFTRLAPDADLGVAVIRAVLESELGDAAGASGHLRGGLRVCRLEPGTVIPSAVVLIAGLGDSLHPGGSGSLSWDLLNRSDATTAMEFTAEHPDGRADALDAFRAAVCSARSRLHLAWTGVTLTKQEPRGPSVSLAELREAAERCLAPDDRASLARTEPPHPFSRRVFSETAGSLVTRSGATTWLAAAEAIAAVTAPNSGFGHGGSARDDISTAISLESLASCVSDPTRHFVQRAMGVASAEDGEDPPEHEPQGLAPLTTSGVRIEYREIAHRIQDFVRGNRQRAQAQWREWLRRQPQMPFGAEGDAAAEQLMRVWWDRIHAAQSAPRRAPTSVTLRVGDWTIEGRLDQLTALERRVFSLYEVKPKSAVREWVKHLVMNACALERGDLPRRTVIDAPGEWAFGAVDHPVELLSDLCALYAEAGSRPVALMRAAGVALLKAKDVQAARAAAFREWNGGFVGTPEQNRPWHRLCWPSRDVLADDVFYGALQQEAARYLRPMLDAMEKDS